MFVVRPREQTERGIKRERTLRTATDLVYKDSQLRREGGGAAVEKDKRRSGERREGGGEEAVVRRQRKGCSRMRQDLITPYNVLFCGCLAYTPVPVCRLGNTVNTPMALFLLLQGLLSLILSSLSFRLLRSSLSRPVPVVVVQVWVVCVYVP